MYSVSGREREDHYFSFYLDLPKQRTNNEVMGELTVNKQYTHMCTCVQYHTFPYLQILSCCREGNCLLFMLSSS